MDFWETRNFRQAKLWRQSASSLFIIVSYRVSISISQHRRIHEKNHWSKLFRSLPILETLLMMLAMQRMSIHRSRMVKEWKMSAQASCQGRYQPQLMFLCPQIKWPYVSRISTQRPILKQSTQFECLAEFAPERECDSASQYGIPKEGFQKINYSGKGLPRQE